MSFSHPIPLYRLGDEKQITLDPLIPSTGIAAIWAFISILVLAYCLYAGHRDRREGRENGVESVGHWKNDPFVPFHGGVAEKGLGGGLLRGVRMGPTMHVPRVQVPPKVQTSHKDRQGGKVGDVGGTRAHQDQQRDRGQTAARAKQAKKVLPSENAAMERMARTRGGMMVDKAAAGPARGTGNQGKVKQAEKSRVRNVTGRRVRS